MRRAALCCSEKSAESVFAQGRRARLESTVALLPGVFSEATFDERANELADVEVIFATWGMPALTPSRLRSLPRLQAVFYAAGSVQAFARPLLERGIVVVSAWRANAIPVAEFTLAQFLLSTKRYFANSNACRSVEGRAAAPVGPGNFGQTVALLGVGAIGRRVIALLKPFDLRVIVFDPFLPVEEAAALGVQKVSLDEAFAQAIVVSNHLANVPATVGLLRGRHFNAMARGATFINTGRGAQVNETEMIAAFIARPDLYALLDVTDPEPPAPESPLWSLPNVKLSAHIAGSVGAEVLRMADLVIDEFARWERGELLEHGVTIEMLDRMA